MQEWMVPGQVLEQVPAAGLATWSHLHRQEEVRHADVATAKDVHTHCGVAAQHERAGT